MRRITFTKSKISYLGLFGHQMEWFRLDRGGDGGQRMGRLACHYYAFRTAVRERVADACLVTEHRTSLRHPFIDRAHHL